MERKRILTIPKILIHTLILSLAASALHFVYKLSGKILVIGLFSPVNESVWEHLKAMFFPLLIWWIVMCLIRNKKWGIPVSVWLFSAAISLVVAPLSVVLLFYGYTGALGFHALFIDILLVPIGYFAALWLAARFLTYLKPNKWLAVISVVVIVALLIVFIAFTLSPPHLPICFDKRAQKYGI
ncbi:MAG: DUF6512 family protein [Bacillota bacterium]|jgi:hypothetical protein